MTPEPKEQAVPVVGVEEAVERVSAYEAIWRDRVGRGWMGPDYGFGEGTILNVEDLRTILQALQGSSFASAQDTHRATEQPVVGDWKAVERLAYGYELMHHAICNMAGTSGASGRWYYDKANEVFSRVSPVFRVAADSNPHKPGDCLTGHGSFLRSVRKADSGEAALGGDEAEGGVNQDLQAQLKAAYEALEQIAAAWTGKKVLDHKNTFQGGFDLGCEWGADIARQALARRGEG